MVRPLNPSAPAGVRLSLIIGFASALLAGWCEAAPAREVIPDPPARYFNDYALLTSQATREELNRLLEEFEKTASSQIVVVIFPKLQSDSSLEDYTHRVFNAWKVGQKGKNNGAVLFVFAQERRMRLAVGYGLEGAIPDALAKRIIEEEIKPHFQRGDYDAGLRAGVQAILQAARGEYKGTGRTAAQARPNRSRSRSRSRGAPVGVFIVMFAVIIAMRRATRGTVYNRRGRAPWRGAYWPGALTSGRTSSWSGGGWGGGWSGGGSGGFSGGGGRSGGGGASGGW